MTFTTRVVRTIKVTKRDLHCCWFCYTSQGTEPETVLWKQQLYIGVAHTQGNLPFMEWGMPYWYWGSSSCGVQDSERGAVFALPAWWWMAEVLCQLHSPLRSNWWQESQQDCLHGGEVLPTCPLGKIHFKKSVLHI